MRTTAIVIWHQHLNCSPYKPTSVVASQRDATRQGYTYKPQLELHAFKPQLELQQRLDAALPSGLCLTAAEALRPSVSGGYESSDGNEELSKPSAASLVAILCPLSPLLS